MRTTILALVATTTLLTSACADDLTAPSPDISSGEGQGAPVLVAADESLALADQWIVVLQPGVRPAASLARALTTASGGRVGRAFDAAVRGFTATLSEEEVERLRLDPNVAYIEQDARVGVSGSDWNLERIGQGSFALRFGGVATGAGVNVYVIDTGIRLTHEEFGGRARSALDAVDGGAADDCNGHGTHVAGTIGGATHGVARDVTLHAVRVLDCGGTGTLSDVIAGIDWVAANHVKPAVANLSIAGGASRAVDEAVARAIDAGVVFVVAAGNDARDACGYSPARAAAAITVGATTRTDAVWALSNQGSCIDLFAPGDGIESAGIASDAAAVTMSGTSMAAPHVAGAAALQLEDMPGATPAAVEAALIATAAHGRLTRLGAGSPDRFLQIRAVPSWQEMRDRVR